VVGLLGRDELELELAAGLLALADGPHVEPLLPAARLGAVKLK
jgi:hypothetical protein